MKMSSEKWAAWLLTGILIVSIRSALAAPLVVDKLEASVNSDLILLSDVTKFKEIAKLRAQLDPLFGGTPLASEGSSASTPEIVNFLVDERLVSQQFPVTDSEVEQEINNIQANNHIDRTTLKNALGAQGYTFPDYFELIRTSKSKRDLIDREIRTKVSITDDDIKNYFYNKYAKSSSIPVAYHLQVITVSPRNYKTPSAAKDAAQRALKDIRSGDAFEEVAKRFGDDAVAASGGDLGVVTEDQMSPMIREQVKKLQINQVSEVFGNNTSGYYILKLVDIKTGDSERFDKMREDIRNQLLTSEYQHQIALWIERQRQSAFIHKAGEASIAGLPVAPHQ